MKTVETTTSSPNSTNAVLGEVFDDYSQLELEVEFLTYWIKRDNPDMPFEEVRKKAVRQAKEAYEDFA